MLAEKLLNRTDDYNKSLENKYSEDIIKTLLETIPGLIEEEHYDFAKKLLGCAENQNTDKDGNRLDKNYKNSTKILEMWIELASK